MGRGAPAAEHRAGGRIKVLFLIGTLEIGGSETQLVELASRLDRRAFEPFVCTVTQGGALEAMLRERGIRVCSLRFVGRARRSLWTIPAMALGAVSAVVRLWRLLRRERPDIIHGILISAYVLGTFVGRLAGMKRIVASRRSLGRFKERMYAYLLLERLADRYTDVFIANSEAVREDTLAREPINPADIFVIHNGLDFGRFDAPRDSQLEASLRLGSPRVIVVSNFIKYKGHEFFVRAWAEVLREFPAATAMLVGDGAERPTIEAAGEALGIRPSLRFLGVRHDVPALLALSDVYVHASLEEGYSNALLEAMAAGLPVVATAVGGNVEAVRDGVSGLLVPPADATALAAGMLQLLRDRHSAAAMGSRARRFVRERHDMNTVVRQYEAVYRALLVPGTDIRRAASDAATRSPLEAASGTCAE